MGVENPTLVTIQDEAITQGLARTLNFAGAGVTATLVGNTATITIPGGGGPGGLSATRVTVALPYPTRRSHSVNIIDATVTVASRVLAWTSGLDDANPASSMEDSMIIQAITGAGVFTLRIESRLPLGGNVSFDYVVLT